MAFKTKLSFFIFFMAVLSLMVTKETYGCDASSGCFHAATKIESRKLLAGFRIGDQHLWKRELRLVPTGPNPLHHRDLPPKKSGTYL